MTQITDTYKAEHIAAFNTCIRVIGGNTKTYRALKLKSVSVVNGWQARGRLPATHALPLQRAAVVAAAKKDIPIRGIPSLETLLTHKQPSGCHDDAKATAA